MTLRETVFRCSWSTPDAERCMYVCAWTAREALEELYAELRAASIAIPDDVTVEEIGVRSSRVSDAQASS